MEPWAKRLNELIAAGADRGLSVPGLVKAVKARQSSVWQWFKAPPGKSVTKMISADNAVRAAAYVGTTAEYLMTGRGSLGEPSQLARLDEASLTDALDDMGKVLRMARMTLPHTADQAAVIKVFYDERVAPSGDAERAAADALEVILDRGVKA